MAKKIRTYSIVLASDKHTGRNDWKVKADNDQEALEKVAAKTGRTVDELFVSSFWANN
jgi:hypothetical protein